MELDSLSKWRNSRWFGLPITPYPLATSSIPYPSSWRKRTP